MPRKSKFTWNASNTEAFQKTIRNFNAKIYYQRKAHPETSHLLPDTIKKQEKTRMIETFNDEYITQTDFDRQIKSLKRFSRKDATKVVEDVDGNPMLKWQKKEIQYKVNTVNQKLKKERDLAIKSNPTLKTNDLELEELEPIRIENVSKRNWKKFEQMLDKKIMSKDYERRIEHYKEKFLSKLESLPADTEDAYNFFKRIPANVLWQARYNKDKGLNARIFYDPLDDAQFLVDNSIERWQDYLKLEDGETYEDLDNKEFIEALEKMKKKGK